MIEVLVPLSIIMFVLIFIGATVLVGHASKEVVPRIIKTLFGMKINVVLEGTLEKLFMYSGLGLTFIIVYSAVLSIFGIFNQIGVLLIVGFMVIIELLVLVLRKKGEKTTISSCIGIIKRYLIGITKDRRQIFIVCLFLAGVIWFFSPAIQLASYPGGDDRAYVYITKQFIDKGTVFITIDSPFAYPYMNHLLMAGFMAEASFFYNLLQVLGIPATVPVIHLFLTLLFFSMTPISIYLFTFGLSRNRGFSIAVAFTALFMWNSALLYFDWGGIGETMGYFLIPLFGLLDYGLDQYFIRNRFGLRTFAGTLILKLVLLAIVMYVHMYSLFLFIFTTIIVCPLMAMRNYRPAKAGNGKDKIKIYLRIVSPYIVIFLGLIVALIGIKAILRLTGGQNIAFETVYDFVISSTENIMIFQPQLDWTANWLVFRNGYGLDYSLSTLRMIISTFWGDWFPTFLALYVFFLVSMRVSRNKETPLQVEGIQILGFTNVMVVGAMVFFLFTQNSPFGWYFIPYPMAKLVLTVRLYYQVGMFLFYLEALPLYLLYVYLIKEIAGTRSTIRKKSSRASLRGIMNRVNTKKIAAGAIVIIIAASITLPSTIGYYDNYVRSRGESVVTIDDLSAFNWISTNISVNTRFFVNLVDGGGYIYPYTGRIALPPDAMRVWSSSNETWKDFLEVETMLQAGNITQYLIQRLRGYNVSYVYVGEKVQYGGPQFNVIALIQSPYFEIAFNQGGAYVFRIKAA